MYLFYHFPTLIVSSLPPTAELTFNTQVTKPLSTPDHAARTCEESLDGSSFLHVNPRICIQPDKLLNVIYGPVSVSVANALGDFYTLLWQMTTQAAWHKHGLVFQ